MEVVGFFPKTGKIEFVVVHDQIHDRWQTVSRTLNWHLTDRWAGVAIKDFALANGFAALPKPIEMDFFIKHISEFEK